MGIANNTISEIANELYDAYKEKKPIEPITGKNELDLEDSYQIQKEFSLLRQKNGEYPHGYKIGMANPKSRKRMGVDEPVFGRIHDNDIKIDNNLNISSYISPRLEPELGFILGSDVREGASYLDIISSIHSIIPVVEVPDCRIKNWEVTVEDLVADNSAAGSVICNMTLRSFQQIDPSLEGVVTQRNGEFVNGGLTLNSIGDPIQCIVWLANKLNQQQKRLRGGDLVITGKIGSSAENLEKDDQIYFKFTNLGSMCVFVH